MEEKRCAVCSLIKPLFLFSIKADNPQFYYATCRKCLRIKRQRDRKTARNWKWPYAKGLHTMLRDPKYIKHKKELFNNNGNGWWWGNGFWNGKTETITDKVYRSNNKKKERYNDTNEHTI